MLYYTSVIYADQGCVHDSSDNSTGQVGADSTWCMHAAQTDASSVVAVGAWTDRQKHVLLDCFVSVIHLKAAAVVMTVSAVTCSHT